jgi:hypothetical protein
MRPSLSTNYVPGSQLISGLGLLSDGGFTSCNRLDFGGLASSSSPSVAGYCSRLGGYGYENAGGSGTSSTADGGFHVATNGFLQAAAVAAVAAVGAAGLGLTATSAAGSSGETSGSTADNGLYYDSAFQKLHGSTGAAVGNNVMSWTSMDSYQSMEACK